MREIKFRAWDKDNKVMCTSDIIGNWKTEYLLDLEMTVWDTSKGLNFDAIIEDRFEFMQYTGLKDKNGKEIYEGDIVRIEDYYENVRIGIIAFDSGTYKLQNLGQSFYYDFGNDGEYDWESIENVDEDNIEVLGNIYENPELLTKQSEVLNMKGGEEVEEIPQMKGTKEALDELMI